jgi:glyoxylase-like metal-dependent hydrolase (beta-lactamase superfamily II)
MKLSSISRLLVAATVAAIVALVAMSAVVVPAIAAAPAQHTQVPGYYRTTVGDDEVTALYDGGVRIDLALLHGDPAMIQNLLQAFIPNDPKSAWTSVAGFLVNTGGKLVLIDTGTGGNWGGPTTGELVRNLKTAGYKPEQVDLVLLTHLHADHVGGIYDAKGKRVFPNAQIRMRQADSDFWLSKDIAAKAPQEARVFFQVAREAAAPYQAAGKWAPFEGTDELVPGIRPYPIPGHTPGHTGYMVSSKGQSLLIWGDAAHVMAVQMPHPEVGIDFDSDSPTAIKTREELFAKLAAEKTPIAAAHMPFPSLGRLHTENTGYTWVPVTFMDLN